MSRRRLAARATFATMVGAMLVCGIARAETRYITEELIVGVYEQSDLSGERVAQVRSAEAVELLASEGDAARIRTGDGTEGWLKASYLESQQPLAPQVASLRAEVEKLRKAESSGARVDPKPLQKEIADLRAQLEAANRRVEEVQAAQPPAAQREDEEPIRAAAPARNQPLRTALWVLFAAASAGLTGFALGYRTLERRVRAKYGGLKVY